MSKKFVVIRYTPGSGGKFIALLLQLSQSVNCWSDDMNSIASAQDALCWFQNHFKKPWADWLKNEPEIPYQTDFVSNRFDRGNNVDFDQAMSYLENDHLFNKHFNNDKKIVLISNKSAIPKWLQNRATFVNLYIDDKWAKKWVHSAKITKLFYEVKPNTWIIKQDHPDYCSDKRSILASKFNNKTEFTGSRFSFLKQFIVNDENLKQFQDKTSITADTTNNTVDQFWFKISNLKFRNELLSSFKKLCAELEIQTVEDKWLNLCIDHYLSLHDIVNIAQLDLGNYNELR